MTATPAQPAQPGSISPPWRLVVFVLASVVGVLALRLVHSFVSPWIPVALRPASFALVMLGGLLIGHAWTLQQVEPRGWRFVGLDRAALATRPLVRSLLLGAGAIVLPVSAMVAMGWYRFDSTAPVPLLASALATLSFLAPAALWEELFLRGYAFALLVERWTATWAILVTSLAFGVMHLLNDGATVQSVSVVALAGIFLGLVRLRTGSLYAAWMAHLGWNAALAIGFHATVSGVELATPSYRLVETGPDWATGGAWGPEGGVFAAAGLVAAILIMVRPVRTAASITESPDE